MTAALVAAPRKDVHPGVREVQDSDFWGLPLHTPLTPGIKAAQKAKGFGGGPASRAAKAARLGGGEGARVEAARARQPSAKDRIRNWFRTPEATGEAAKILDGFDPRTFQSDQQAGQYALNRARPGRFEKAPHWSTESRENIASDSLSGFHEAQSAIRRGDADSPQAKAFIARFQRNSADTTDDLLVSRRVPLDAFPDGVEGLAGKEVRDAAYFQGNLGTPIGSAPVLLTVAVPKGTRAMFTGNGPNDRGVILDRDQRLQITKVTPDGKGGWYVAAVAVPRSGAPAGEMKEGRDATGSTSAKAGGPGAPDLLERETGTRKPGFAQPRRFSEPETHAAPPPEQRRLRVQEAEEPAAIRQVRKLPDDITEELNNPKTTVARMREISKEYDFKVPGSITKKVDVRDFLLGKQKEGPQPERKQLSAEAVAQLEDPKTTVAQLRKIAKDHGIKIPSTATRKADIKAHLVEIGDVRSAAPDSLKPGERDDFRAGWDAVGKAPAGSAQRELNEVFIDVRGGRMGLLEGARRLDTSAELDREELGRVRGKDDKKAERLEEEIAAKKRAAKFLRDYQEKRSAPAEAAPVPAKKAAPRKTAPVKAAKAMPAKSTVSQGTPRAVPEMDAAELEKFNEGQLRVMAKNRGIDVSPDATKAEIIDALTSGKSIEEDLFPGFTEEQLRDIAQARGIHVPADATKAEVARLLTAGGGAMSGPGSLASPVPRSAVQVRPALAGATGHRSLARATQTEYKRITGRDLAVDFGPDPDLSLDTSREHMEGVLRAAEAWPDTDLREVRWFNGALAPPGEGGLWAIGGNGGIAFNTAYTSKANRERYLRELEAGIAGWDQGGSGFHPRGANTPAAVAMHEFGHLISPEREARGYPGVVRHLQRRAREERVPPSRLIRREVSLYADKNPSELVAEAILDVLINGDAAGRLSREISDLLRTGRL